VQTVTAEQNPLFHSILQRFEERTGCPVLVNTSFNVRASRWSARRMTPTAAFATPKWTT
jgi:predicted NodU family carbamoyl transferase